MIGVDGGDDWFLFGLFVYGVGVDVGLVVCWLCVGWCCWCDIWFGWCGDC